jgi:hypothetical protein
MTIHLLRNAIFVDQSFNFITIFTINSILYPVYAKNSIRLPDAINV